MLAGDPIDNGVCERVIGCAIEVHRHLGPGLLEHTYESALCLELEWGGLSFSRQPRFPLHYKGQLLSEHRPDIIVADRVVIEVKSTERFHPVYLAQMLTYLRVTNLRVGLVLNFNSAWLKQGIRRVVR